MYKEGNKAMCQSRKGTELVVNDNTNNVQCQINPKELTTETECSPVYYANGRNPFKYKNSK